MTCKENKFSIVSYRPEDQNYLARIFAENASGSLVCDILLDDLNKKDLQQIDRYHKIWTIVCDEDPGKKLGVLVLQKVSYKHASAELIVVFDDLALYSNSDFIKKVLTLFNKEFFDELNFVRLQGVVLENNLKLRQAFEEAGFVEEGLLRSKFEMKDKRYDAYVMSLLKIEWERSKK